MFGLFVAMESSSEWTAPGELLQDPAKETISVPLPSGTARRRAGSRDGVSAQSDHGPMKGAPEVVCAGAGFPRWPSGMLKTDSQTCVGTAELHVPDDATAGNNPRTAGDICGTFRL